MSEDFCRQTRRFSAAILTDCKEKQRGMLAKRPLRWCAMVMKVTSRHVSEISALFAKFVTFSEKKEWNKA
ncbi:MAG: hypothetical protein ACLRLR_01315 [Faecalibacterium prausnitzii]|jgi:hypothetical protein